MSLAVYLNFDGDTREAIQFYSDIFGYTEDPKIMVYGDMDPDASAETRNLVMNAQIYVHGTLVMFADAFPGYPYTKGNNVSLTVITQDENEARTLFDKLGEGGNVSMPLQETSWSPLYGSLIDKYGVDWQINYDAERVYA